MTAEQPEPRGEHVTRGAEGYVCWCDGEDGCEQLASEPFGLCPECTRFGHGVLKERFGLTGRDLRVMP